METQLRKSSASIWWSSWDIPCSWHFFLFLFTTMSTRGSWRSFIVKLLLFMVLWQQSYDDTTSYKPTLRRAVVIAPSMAAVSSSIAAAIRWLAPLLARKDKRSSKWYYSDTHTSWGYRLRTDTLHTLLNKRLLYVNANEHYKKASITQYA